MYERLTKRDRYGHAYTNETVNDRGMTSKDGLHFEKHYFENGTSAYDGKPIDRLCDLEDKIEQGKILELPCKVGDTLWKIEDVWHLDDRATWKYHYEKEILEFRVRSISISCNSKGIWTKKFRICEVQNGKTIDKQRNIEFGDYGKTVFLTREEAEKALAERSENGK